MQQSQFIAYKQLYSIYSVLSYQYLWLGSYLSLSLIQSYLYCLCIYTVFIVHSIYLVVQYLYSIVFNVELTSILGVWYPITLNKVFILLNYTTVQSTKSLSKLIVILYMYHPSPSIQGQVWVDPTIGCLFYFLSGSNPTYQCAGGRILNSIRVNFFW